ncbi:hypothetical protein L9F63_005304, partial [Diploptera punctata]
HIYEVLNNIPILTILRDKIPILMNTSPDLNQGPSTYSLHKTFKIHFQYLDSSGLTIMYNTLDIFLYRS